MSVVLKICIVHWMMRVVFMKLNCVSLWVKLELYKCSLPTESKVLIYCKPVRRRRTINTNTEPRSSWSSLMWCDLNLISPSQLDVTVSGSLGEFPVCLYWLLRCTFLFLPQHHIQSSHQVTQAGFHMTVIICPIMNAMRRSGRFKNRFREIKWCERRYQQ